jgi:hypothetical protein
VLKKILKISRKALSNESILRSVSLIIAAFITCNLNITGKSSKNVNQNDFVASFNYSNYFWKTITAWLTEV